MKAYHACAGVVLLLHAVQVALLDDVAIFRGQFGQHTCNTCTERYHRVGLLDGLRKFFRQFDGRAMQTQMVDQCIARNLIEPGTLIVEIAESTALAYRLDEHILQQVFGQVNICHAMLQVIAQFIFVRAP